MSGETALQRSLRRQKAIFSGSIVLTPVDNFPAFDILDNDSRWLHGLYASDKVRSSNQLKQSAIQFAGRHNITRDINLIHEKMAKLFKADYASLRLLSGLHAHMVLFMGLAEIGEKIALLPALGGGHFATQGILRRLGLTTIDLIIDYKNCRVDPIATRRLINKEKPDILFIDRSEGLKFEDFSWVKDLEVPIKIFDSSQYVPQILIGQYPNPFDWGFDLQIFTLHKSFPGPQKAGVVGRGENIWAKVLQSVGSFVSSSHIENSYLTGLILENPAPFSTYTSRLVPTAEALEKALAQRQVPIINRESIGEADWKGTQHVWIKMKDQDQAFQTWEALAANRIQVNYRKLPYNLGWGLRLGTTAAVSRGLTEHNVPFLADIIHDVVLTPESRQFRRKTTELAEKMRYNSPFKQS